MLSQLEYVNNELTKGNTLTKICESVGIGRTTIRDRFLIESYRFNKTNNTYEYDKSIIKVLKNHVKGQLELFNDNESFTTSYSNEKILPPNKSIAIVNKQLQNKNVAKTDTEVQGLADFNNIKNDLLDLVQNKDDLMEMLKNYKSTINVIDVPQLDINTLPQNLQRDITTKSVKLYSPVYYSFDKLCKAYSSIKKQDLISLALFEFTNKYKK